MQAFHGTTVLSVRNDRQVAVGGDGQVSLGDTVMKGNAIKVRKLYHDKLIANFAGGTADAFTLLKIEAALEKYHGQLARSAVELAKEWRSDRALRKLEAMLIVADATATLLVGGNGDVIEPEAGVLAIGSGSNYARAAACQPENTDFNPEDIVRKAMAIAGDICVYANHSLTLEAVLMPNNESLTPKQIAAELDRHIVGQSDAKRAVAIALRNRWRRMQLDRATR